MYFSIRSFAFFFFPNILFAQILPIADVRQMPVGTTVSFEGIVTNSGELGKIRHIQDGSAGIAVFPGTGSAPNFEQSVNTGDKVMITGKLILFNNLLEINPVTSFTVVSSQNVLPAAVPIALGNIDAELESQIVTLNCISFQNPGAVFNSASTYPIADANGIQGFIYLRNTSPFFNGNIPAGTVALTGILSRYNNEFQILPRLAEDMLAMPCYFFIENPAQSNIAQTEFTVSWKTNEPSFSILKYGTTPQLGQEIASTSNTTDHSVALTNLQPGTIYWVQAVATHNNLTITSPITPFATQSTSSGEIQVYFNHNVDLSVGSGLAPAGQSYGEVLAATIDRINKAEKTIDVAMFNNNRTDLTNALKAAHARGVRVRYIAASFNQNLALDPPPAFPVLEGNDDFLMHDKFMVIDANLADKAWVMSGSMNWTSGNVVDDFNNTLFIQDQSLASAYELEFVEMWGSNGTQPNANNAKFGAAKTNNTPHRFMIGNIPVESYFSPSDNTSKQIETAIKTADHDLQFALLIFTKNSIGDEVLARNQAGVVCRGIIEDALEVGSEYTYLTDNGVDIMPDPFPNRIMHHKYGIIDATLLDSDPTVVTGSHNWTETANTQNDENTLIIHDADIATLFLQDFEQRYKGIVHTKVLTEGGDIVIYPNPVTEKLTIASHNSIQQLEIWDVTGNNFWTETINSNQTIELNTAFLPSGSYFIKIVEGEQASIRYFQKI